MPDTDRVDRRADACALATLRPVQLFGRGQLVGDNVAQPALIGSSVELPFVMALLGVFCGLETFGLVGLFIGPAIMSAVLLAWRQWADPEPGSPARPAAQARVGPDVAA